MKPVVLALAAAGLLAGGGAGWAQSTQGNAAGNAAPGHTVPTMTPGPTSDSTTVHNESIPTTMEHGNNAGAAITNNNQAVATTSGNAPAPARGKNSFTMGEAKSRIERNGFSDVSGLSKDNDGIWRGKAQKDGSSTTVWLDYKGNVGQSR
jgi:hypothetical protein